MRRRYRPVRDAFSIFMEISIVLALVLLGVIALGLGT